MRCLLLIAQAGRFAQISEPGNAETTLPVLETSIYEARRLSCPDQENRKAWHGEQGPSQESPKLKPLQPELCKP